MFICIHAQVNCSHSPSPGLWYWILSWSPFKPSFPHAVFVSHAQSEDLQPACPDTSQHGWAAATVRPAHHLQKAGSECTDRPELSFSAHRGTGTKLKIYLIHQQWTNKQKLQSQNTGDTKISKFISCNLRGDKIPVEWSDKFGSGSPLPAFGFPLYFSFPTVI